MCVLSSVYTGGDFDLQETLKRASEMQQLPSLYPRTDLSGFIVAFRSVFAIRPLALLKRIRVLVPISDRELDFSL